MKFKFSYFENPSLETRFNPSSQASVYQRGHAKCFLKKKDGDQTVSYSASKAPVKFKERLHLVIKIKVP